MRTRLELVTSDTMIERLADTLFMEMFPDDALAPLLKGRDAKAVTRDLRALLAAILSQGNAAHAPLPALFDGAYLSANQRMRLARLIVDCLVEARVQPAWTLAALDRFYTVLHAHAPLHRPMQAERPQLRVF